MLEHAVLLIARDKASSRREILAADRGEPIGYALWHVPRGWCRFLGRSVLAVHEREDDPLLCTIRRSWSLLPWYEVRDADDQRIGRMLGPVVQDGEEQRLALCCADGPRQALFQTPTGIPLARLEREQEADRLTFEAVIEKEPFMKMLLLGAVLLG